MFDDFHNEQNESDINSDDDSSSSISDDSESSPPDEKQQKMNYDLYWGWLGHLIGYISYVERK